LKSGNTDSILICTYASRLKQISS